MEEVKTKLIRQAEWYRPLYAKVKDKGLLELCDIKIYDENGIIFDLGYGYFDNDKEMTINGEVIYKIKENFSKKVNYVISVKEYYSRERRYALYIYIGNVDFEYIGLKKEYQNVYKKYLLNGVEVKEHLANLTLNVYRYRELVEKEIGKIKSYTLPLKQEEIEDICNKIMKYNKLILEEEEWIKGYEPTEKDLLDNFETVMKRDI